MIGDFAEAISEWGVGFSQSEEKLRQEQIALKKEHVESLNHDLAFLKIKRNQYAEDWDFFNLEKTDKEIDLKEKQLKEVCISLSQE